MSVQQTPVCITQQCLTAFAHCHVRLLGAFCFFSVGNRFGLISSDFSLKAKATLTETEQMRIELEEDRIPKTEAAKIVHTVYSKPLAGSQGRPLKLTYKITSDAEKRGDFHLIRHCSITYFLMPMGTLGLANAWKASSFGLLNAHQDIWSGPYKRNPHSEIV
jgi:hypothetical protein